MIGPIRWGPFDGHTPIEVSQVRPAFAHLPEAFDGFRIALLADLHYGQYVRAAFVRRVLQLVRRQQPDLALLCGDMLNKPRRYAESFGEMLAELAGEIPCYAVFGNHERHADADLYRRTMREAGVDFLLNQHCLVRRDRGSRAGPAIALAGVDDPKVGRPDFHAALGGIRPGTFTILAAHKPDLADMAPPGLAVDLMLCGHTHGGQIRLFGWTVVTETRNPSYVSGLTLRGPGFPLYISRGLGIVRIPVRVGSDPELPVITLRRGA